MTNTKIINSIIPNTDNFTWRELNCMYKPVAIILKSFDERLFDLFLAYYSFIDIYGLDDTFYKFNVGKSVHPLFVYLKKNLESIFNIKIENYSYDNEKKFHNAIINSINEDKIPLIPGNLRGLFYNTMYKIKDHIHCFIIKGYDKKRKIYYILDNMHIDDGASTIYRNFTITFKNLYDLYKLSKNANCMFFSQKQNIDIKKIITNISSELDAVINMKIKVNLVEQRFFNDLSNSIHFDGLDEKLAIANERKVFIDSTMKILFDNGYSQVELDKICKKYNTCIKNWSLLRTKEIMLNEHTGNLQQIEEKICVFLYADIGVLKEIAHCYKGISFQSCYNSQKEYEIINNNGAVVSENDGLFSIVLDSTKVYDDWINTANAPKILWNVNNEELFTFSVKLSINAKTGASFLCGIVIETDDEKIYFGNIKNLQTVIFIPLRNEDYSVYEKDIVITDFMIKSSGCGKIGYYIAENDSYRCIYSEKKEMKIKKIGIFAKSWEYTDAQISYKIKLVK